jgi:hypothetical protein
LYFPELSCKTYNRYYNIVCTANYSCCFDAVLESTMSNLKMKPEFNDLQGQQANAGSSRDNHGAPAEASNPGALLFNPMGGRRLRRSGQALRLAPPSDDGFHLFRVY